MARIANGYAEAPEASESVGAVAGAAVAMTGRSPARAGDRSS
jgi:hypothetical protein